MSDLNNNLFVIMRRSAVLLIAGASVHVLCGLLDSFRLAALICTAIAVEIFASRIGLRWSVDSSNNFARSLLSFAKGLGLGLAMSAFIAAVLALVGSASFEIAFFAPSTVLLGLVACLAEAVRDELLYRGIPLTIMRSRFDNRVAIAFVCLLSATPIFSQQTLHGAAFLISVSSALISSVLWCVGRGAFLPLGFRSAFAFAVTVLLAGGGVDMRLKSGALFPFTCANGAPALWMAACTVAFAVAVFARFSRQIARAQAG
jgi:hypothetical protein